MNGYVIYINVHCVLSLEIAVSKTARLCTVTGAYNRCIEYFFKRTYSSCKCTLNLSRSTMNLELMLTLPT